MVVACQDLERNPRKMLQVPGHDKSHFRKRISPKNHIFVELVDYFVRIFTFGRFLLQTASTSRTISMQRFSGM